MVLQSMKNKIVHDYDGVNLTLIWEILETDLLELKNQLEELYNKI